MCEIILMSSLALCFYHLIRLKSLPSRKPESPVGRLDIELLWIPSIFLPTIDQQEVAEFLIAVIKCNIPGYREARGQTQWPTTCLCSTELILNHTTCLLRIQTCVGAKGVGLSKANLHFYFGRGRRGFPHLAGYLKNFKQINCHRLSKA